MKIQQSSYSCVGCNLGSIYIGYFNKVEYRHNTPVLHTSTRRHISSSVLQHLTVNERQTIHVDNAITYTILTHVIGAEFSTLFIDTLLVFFCHW